MTTEQLQTWLTSPAALFLVMLGASFCNVLKQLTVASRQGTAMSCGAYLAHWPETLGTLFGNALAFAALVVLNQLNFASALGIGYGLNSVVDLMRSGGRSAAVAVPEANRS